MDRLPGLLAGPPKTVGNRNPMLRLIALNEAMSYRSVTVGGFKRSGGHDDETLGHSGMHCSWKMIFCESKSECMGRHQRIFRQRGRQKLLCRPVLSTISDRRLPWLRTSDAYLQN